MNNYFEENEYETTFDALVDYIKCLPKATVKMINPSRYKLLMRTAAQLTDLLRKTQPEGEIDIEINDLLNLGSISTELDLLTIEEPLAFADVIYTADNFEVYPLTNGKIRLDITFHSILKNLA
ncbi:MAG: hypothetical protein UGF89_08080 [Acutalibacteraceae bacterium]|nr:hypothetical protein [Acutalibacteraceae bacterium]